MYLKWPLLSLSNSHTKHNTHTLQVAIHHFLLFQTSQSFLDTHWKCFSVQSLVGFFSMWGWNTFYQNLHCWRLWMCFCPYMCTDPWKLNLCCHHICERSGLLGVLTIPKRAMRECDRTQYQSEHSNFWNGKGPSFSPEELEESLFSKFLA